MSKSKNDDVKKKQNRKHREINKEERLQLERLADIVLDYMFNNSNAKQ